ncbi:hypothetical protein CRG98_023520 [Punica granatum]|uniref:Reverse transcriptase Ty1/copia-type domain-containing protein n=1 Tax=Punica granatum TaxID=22663 RepID=A0A2I0JIJ8_PUNGR|nr:hypothetical protein CRG98_023520 [Punica granatum]
MDIQQRTHEVFICQKKYPKEILKRFQMEECKSVSTPMNQKEKLQKNDGADPADGARYKSLIGCLMYLTATRPDTHMVAAKRVVRYLKEISSYGVKFTRSSVFKLQSYADSDWAGSLDDMKITSGYYFSLGSAFFSWSSMKQEVVARSTAEAEFIAATTATNQAVWLRKLMKDLDMGSEEAT